MPGTQPDCLANKSRCETVHDMAFPSLFPKIISVLKTIPIRKFDDPNRERVDDCNDGMPTSL